MSQRAKDLLKVEGLTVSYSSEQGDQKVVSSLDFSLKEGEVVGLVGESGSGKTQVSLSLIRLLPEEAKVEGKVTLLGKGDLMTYSEKEMNQIRGKEISMIFQEPMTALNPVFTVGFQVEEALHAHGTYSKQEAREEALRLLKLVKIPKAERRLDEYPHELSGGMRQRVLIAIALASKPRLLIADEPTTALDVTTQAEILDLLRELQEKVKISILFITHDLGVVAELCDRVFVMYQGRLVEEGTVKSIFTCTSHPYTKLLLDSVPKLGEDLPAIPRKESFESLQSKKGEKACSFYHRCLFSEKSPCSEKSPSLKLLEESHKVACFYPEKLMGEKKV